MSAAVTLRRAAIADLPAIVAMETACFSHPWSEENLRGELEKENGCFLLAQMGNTPVGYASLYIAGGVGYVNNIAVLPDFRRMGAGDRLVAALVDYCIAQKAESITLEVRAQNPAAVALYQKHGFQTVGVRRGFYRDPPDDACIMTRTF